MRGRCVRRSEEAIRLSPSLYINAHQKTLQCNITIVHGLLLMYMMASWHAGCCAFKYSGGPQKLYGRLNLVSQNLHGGFGALSICPGNPNGFLGCFENLSTSLKKEDGSKGPPL
jgi:hypothetical protein